MSSKGRRKADQLSTIPETMRESTQVYVNTANEDHYIPVPATWAHYTAVTVDQT